MIYFTAKKVERCSAPFAHARQKVGQASCLSALARSEVEVGDE